MGKIWAGCRVSNSRACSLSNFKTIIQTSTDKQQGVHGDVHTANRQQHSTQIMWFF
jgi:hypothetical protein